MRSIHLPPVRCGFRSRRALPAGDRPPPSGYLGHPGPEPPRPKITQARRMRLGRHPAARLVNRKPSSSVKSSKAVIHAFSRQCRFVLFGGHLGGFDLCCGTVDAFEPGHAWPAILKHLAGCQGDDEQAKPGQPGRLRRFGSLAAVQQHLPDIGSAQLQGHYFQCDGHRL